MNIQSTLRTYRGLPRSIYVLFIARIINSMGAFVHPFLAIFLTENLGIRESTAGILVMLSAVSYVPGSLIGGFLSDRIGRKKIIIYFQGLAALCFVPCAFLGNSMMVPFLLILSGVFSGAAQPANNAMTADLTNSSNRKESFSLLYLGINLGFSIGPLIAGFLYEHYIEWIFLGDAATTLLSLILVSKFVEESLPNKGAPHEREPVEEGLSDERAEEGSFFSVLRKRPLLLMFAGVSIILSFVFAQHQFALPLQTKATFGKELGTKIYGTLMATNGIVVVLMTLFLTALTQKLEPVLNMAISAILCAIGFGILYFGHTATLFIFSTVIWTLGEILNVTNSGVYLANHTPKSHRGRFNSILSIIMGTGFAVSPVIMGRYIEHHSLRTVWPITFSLGIIAAILMFSLYLYEQKRKKIM